MGVYVSTKGVRKHVAWEQLCVAMRCVCELRVGVSAEGV